MSRKRRWPFREDIFDEIEREFEEMESNVSRIFEEMRQNSMEGEGRPYVYGFSMRMGPDGKPRMEEFGNVPGKEGQDISVGREPLVDVIEGEDEISVIAELPGIEKEDIDLSATENSLGIKVDTPERKYHKELRLPAGVKPDTTGASYKNGVLEVKMKRIEKKKDDGVRVNVE